MKRYDIDLLLIILGVYVEDHSKNKGAKGMKAVIEYDGSKEMKDKADEKGKLAEIEIWRNMVLKIRSFQR